MAITVNLSETCQRNNSPINADVCQAGYIVDFEHGFYADADLTIAEGKKFYPELYETGQELIPSLQTADNFYLELYETGQELIPSLQRADNLYPELLETGQELNELDIIIPPRAFIESDNYFGSESVLESLSTTAHFDVTQEFGSDAGVDLTPACITSIPFNTWKDGYWDSDCNSTNRTAHAKFYTFTLTSDKTVTIKLESTSPTDNYLYLLNGHGDSGTIIAQDDNSGGSGNATIVYALTAGDYTVEATTFASNQTGAFQVIVQLPSPNIENVDAYFGQTLDTPILQAFYVLETDNYFGSVLEELDIIIPPRAFIGSDNYFGSEAIVTTINFDQTFKVNYGFGSESEVTLLANPFDKLEVNFEFGSDGDSFLSTTDLFEGDVYFGSESEVTLLANPFDKLEVNFEFGSTADVVTIHRAASFNAYCFYGSEAFFDLELALSEGVGVCNAYYGSEATLDSIATEAFTIFNEFGSTADVELETQKRFDITFDFGSDADVDLLDNPFDKLDVTYDYGSEADAGISVQLGFKVDYDFGFDAVSSIALPPRAYMELDAYFGSSASIPETILNLRPMEYNVGLNFHIDHNHCESCCDNVDPIYGDSIIRVDQLDFDFSTDNYKDDYPWTGCDFYEVKFATDFLTNPRFTIDFEVDSPAAIAYMPEEYIAFHHEVPDDMLYLDNPPAIYKAELEVNFEVTTGAWLWGDDWDIETVYTRHAPHLSVELTETKYAEIYTGALLEVNLETDIPRWKTEAFHDMISGAQLSVEFESVDYVRFCPGYILPTGNQVNFEFYGVEYTDCNAEWIYTGETCDIALQANYGMAFKVMWEAHLTASLWTEPPWQLTARHGPQMIVSLATTVKLYPKIITVGQILKVDIEPLAWIAGHSTVKVYCDLAVPGPDMIWFTPPDCLENEYIAIDEDGELDYSYYQPDPTQPFLDFELEAAVENRQFKHALDARCFKPGGN